jgi:prolyl oligopeptidase
MIARCTAVALLAAFALSGPVEARDASAPVTRTTDAADVLHGVRVADPYRWLEDAQSAEVQAWTEAQSKRTRAYFDSLPFRAPLRAKLETLEKQGSPRYLGLDATDSRLFAVYVDPKFQQPMIVVMGQNADPAKARVVLDPNKLDPTGGTAFDWFVPSPDGERIAVSLSKGGSEDGSLHVFDVATGRQVGGEIPRVQYPTAGGSAAWTPDGKGLWYTRYPGPDRPADEQHFHQSVWFHRLGEDPKTDVQVFGDGLPKIAAIKLYFSAEAGALVLTVLNGDGGEVAHYVRGEDGRFVQVTRFEDGVTHARFGPDRALYLVSKAAGTPRGEIRRLAPGTLDLKRATTFVPQGEDVIAVDLYYGAESFVFLGGRMYVRYLAGGPSRVRMFDLSGAPQGDLPLPGIAAVDEIEAVGDDLLYSVETYVAPLQFYRFADGKSSPTALKTTSPVSFDDMEVLRVFATSKDGTRVPLNVIRRKGTKLDGTNPVLLNGYGGYGLSETPFFLGASRRMWFDAGGTYVIANLRGGGEYGREWHKQGALTRKQNVFDDFIAAAEYLVSERYTSAERLAILGGSNGGLLMGAVVTQRPELFRAVVAQVGVFDMVRVELDPNGQFNTTEYGTVKDEAQFKALYAYSPYHRVRDGVKYPAMFLPAGANDGRVNPMHSRKMSARLQAATDSGRPIYLYIASGTGHGSGTALSVQLDQRADWLAFLIDQLGMKWAP